MLLEFEQGLPEEQQAPEEGAIEEEVLECSDHQCSSFLKGKPQSILSLLCFENVTLSILYV